MIRLILALLVLLFSRAIYAKEFNEKSIPLTDTDREVSSIVNGSVNSITGNYIETRQDFLIPGPEPLSFERFYSSTDYTHGHLWTSWHPNAWAYIDLYFSYNDTFMSKHVDLTGSTIFLSAEPRGFDEGLKTMRPELKYSGKGLTNNGSGYISGKTNHKNINFNFNKYDNHLQVNTGNGEKRNYALRGYKSEFEKQFGITSRITPNGHIYNYSGGVDFNVTNETGNTVYSSYHYSANNNKCEITTSDGRFAKYHFKQEKVPYDSLHTISYYYLDEVISSDHPKMTYEYGAKNGGVRKKLKKVSIGNNRFIENEYHKDNTVKLQRAPVGTDSKAIVNYQYSYKFNQKDKGSSKKYHLTEVLDAYNHKTNYRSNENLQLESIEKYQGDKNYILYCSDHLVWGEKSSQDEGNLLCKYVKDNNGTVLCARRFIYDTRGNIIEEKVYGNLSGVNMIPVALEANGLPIDNGCECYIKTYSYSNDGMNLMLEEREPNAKRTIYEYLPGKSLLSAKFICDEDLIKIREFYHYKDGVLILKVIDDGITKDQNDLTGTTERYITKIIPKGQAPGYGLPEDESSYYLDFETGKEILLKRVENKYSTKGRLIEQKHYDAKNQYRYCLQWDYDDHGNITREVNANGEAIVKTYDENDNLKRIEGPLPGHHIEYDYDYSNRMIGSTETHPDGKTFRNSNSYDYLGNLKVSIDSFGNSTINEYDEFKRLIKTIQPEVVNEAGNSVKATITKSYDVFNHLISITDGENHITTTSYNIAGKPVLINYPDGTCESFKYNIDGTLHKSVSKNKITTCYTYDFLGRPTLKEHYSGDEDSADKVFLSRTTVSYNSFHQISSTDAMGNYTSYTYDGAGRNLTVAKNGQLTKYEYDELGRLYKTYQHYGERTEEVTIKVQILDFLDRLKEERTEDINGNILRQITYEYDFHGNRTRTTNYLDNNSSSTWIDYNAHKLPVRIEDAEGNFSIIEYNYNYRNSLNQRVLQTIKTDPLGNITLTTFDALNRQVSVVRKNPYGVITGQQECLYDLTNHKKQQRDIVIAVGVENREIINTWKYNSVGQLLELVEAVGTPERKRTSYTYLNGQKETIVKPDLAVIYHTYDIYGRLQSITDKKTFHYIYRYDLNNNLLEVWDQISDTKTVRKYDNNDALIEETLSNGHTLGYQYDLTQRPTRVTLPDESSIEYFYDPTFLKEVRKVAPDGTVSYLHQYNDYDKAGNVQSTNMIVDGGVIEYSYDRMGRNTEISSAFWSQKIPQGGFDSAGNLLSFEIQDSVGLLDSKFSYDNLYQLSSETGSHPHQYHNDSLYNRVSKDGKKHKVNALNQLRDDSEASYDYDHNGNLILKKVKGAETRFTYDGLDRLIEVKVGEEKVKYTYDSFNRRLSKEIYRNELPISFTYLYQGQNEIGSVDEQGNIVELLVLGLGRGAEIGAAVALELQGEVYIPVHDLSGNVTCLIEMKSNSTIETYRYSAFGEELIYNASGELISDSEVGNPWHFSSKRYDQETGFLNFGRRYYDPNIGRWVTPDPIGFEGGPNLYAYVSNSPLTHFDEYGLEESRSNFSYISRECWKYSTAYNNPYLMDSKFASNATGKTLQFFSHMIGIPQVSDVVYHAGRRLEGQDFERSSSFNGVYGTGIEIPGVRVRMVNGINTTYKEFFDQIRKVSEMLGGVNIHYTYNASHGTLSDIAETGAQKIGIPTNSVRLMTKGLKSDLEGVGPKGKVYVFGFSQGGQVTYNSIMNCTPSERKQFDITTLGSAKLIPEKAAGYVQNYVSSRDGVSFLANPFTYAKAKLFGSGNVHFLESKGWHIADHAFDNECYQGVFSDVGKDFKKEHLKGFQ